MRGFDPAFGGEVAVPIVHPHLHQALIVSVRPIHDDWRLDVVWLCDKVVVFDFSIQARIYNCPLIQLTWVVSRSVRVDIHGSYVLVEILGV